MPHTNFQRDAMRIPASGRPPVRLAVAKGQTWAFDASGHWVDGWIWCGPDGYTNPLASMLGYVPQVADAKWFCLVGQYVDDPASAFIVGRHCKRSFSRDGDIIFYPNDMRAMRWNNFGAIELIATLADVDGEWQDHDQPDTPAPSESLSLFALFYERLAGVGFTVALVLCLCALIAFMPQGHDVMRMLAESSSGQAWWLWQPAFFLGVLFLGLQAWFWPRVIIDAALGFDRTQWRPRWLFVWGPRVFGLMPFAATLYAFYRIGRLEILPFMMVLCAAAVFLAIVLGRGFVKRRLRADPVGQPWLRRSWAEGCLALAVVSLVWAGLAPGPMGWALGAPAVAFFGVALIIPPVVCALHLAQRRRWPVVPAMLLVAMASGLLVDNHRVGRRPAINDLMLLGGAEIKPDNQMDLTTALEDWKSVQPDPDHQVMVLVASEGGASRAGFWTGQVLGQLDQRSHGRFARHVFAINSVSGGSVGAVGYIAARSRLSGDAPVDTARLNAFTGKDVLSPVLTGLLFTDLFRAFVPLPLMPDRAQAIEQAWEQAWAQSCGPQSGDCATALAAPFRSMAVGKQDKSWVPIPIVQGTDQMTGRRILTSGLRLPIDADDFYELNAQDVPISTAIHNGARFPLVSPPGTLVDGKGGKRYIIDGGYFDATGLETILQLRQAIMALAPKITIITLFIGYDEPAGPVQPSWILNDPLGHGLGFWHARNGQDAHMKIRAKAVPGYQAFILRPYGGFIPPMDWALSQTAQAYISAATGLNGNCAGKAPCPDPAQRAQNRQSAQDVLQALGVW